MIDGCYYYLTLLKIENKFWKKYYLAKLFIVAWELSKYFTKLFDLEFLILDN